jgi:hypothetical protein
MIERTEKVNDLSILEQHISLAMARTNELEVAYGSGHGSHTRLDHEGPRRDCESSRASIISNSPLIDSLLVYLVR